MVDARTVGLQHRWVAVSVLLTAGYWVLCELFAAMYLLGGDAWQTVAAAAATATAGSFSAARLSPLRRGLEPITGATAFFLGAIAICVATERDVVPIDLHRLEQFDVAAVVASSVGIVVGATVGAWWGKRGAAERLRRITIVLLSAVLVWGSVLTCVGIAALLAALTGSDPVPWTFSAAVVGVAGGGWIAQMLAPERRFDSIATGAMLAIGLAVLPSWGGIVIAALGAPFVFCIAAVGTRSGWAWAEWWRRRQQREVEKPPTAVVVE